VLHLTTCSSGLFPPLPGFGQSPSSRRARRFLDVCAPAPIPGASAGASHIALRISLAWTCLARLFCRPGFVKVRWASKAPLTHRDLLVGGVRGLFAGDALMGMKV